MPPTQRINSVKKHFTIEVPILWRHFDNPIPIYNSIVQTCCLLMPTQLNLRKEKRKKEQTVEPLNKDYMFSLPPL